MAIKDNNPGLLSKMAKFVRNPTTNWADLDSRQPEGESGYSKQALKEMIERKRQNDFVRRREFDQLRKLRSRDPTSGEDPAGRPSFFQSSIASNTGERAVTLKKIDEIEAQMSKQWWKGKQVDAATKSDSFPVSVAPEGKTADSAPVTLAPVGETSTGFALTQPSLMASRDGAGSPDFLPTQLNFGAPKPSIARPPGAVAPPPAGYGSGSGFSSPNLFAVELSDEASDPDLEDAAIRFANGDDAGAESGLLEALQGDNVPGNLVEIWTAALFDFYRATGQQARFDGIAIEFAERFGRSAPAWFSMPGLLALNSDAVSGGASLESMPDHAIWDCPPNMDAAAVADLQRALANAPLPWYVNWSQLTSIRPTALEGLSQLFSAWCTQPVRLRFGGAENLERTLRNYTQSDDKTVSTLWWQVRMDALRIMRWQDEFELVALDYCVTYEVSPPAWQSARCEYIQESKSLADGAAPGSGAAAGASVSGWLRNNSAQGLTVPVGLEDVPATVVELTGEIVGDAVDALQRLEAGLQGAGRLVISCARLIRVDFSAAGSILNWVASREAEGCHVQFRDVHRLVGAFFNVIGINEHARVVLRSN
jgi:STAS domain